jgi:hypothetical protein
MTRTLQDLVTLIMFHVETTSDAKTLDQILLAKLHITLEAAAVLLARREEDAKRQHNPRTLLFLRQRDTVLRLTTLATALGMDVADRNVRSVPLRSFAADGTPEGPTSPHIPKTGGLLSFQDDTFAVSAGNIHDVSSEPGAPAASFCSVTLNDVASFGKVCTNVERGLEQSKVLSCQSHEALPTYYGSQPDKDKVIHVFEKFPYTLEQHLVNLRTAFTQSQKYTFSSQILSALVYLGSGDPRMSPSALAPNSIMISANSKRAVLIDSGLFDAVSLRRGKHVRTGSQSSDVDGEMRTVYSASVVLYEMWTGALYDAPWGLTGDMSARSDPWSRSNADVPEAVRHLIEQGLNDVSDARPTLVEMYLELEEHRTMVDFRNAMAAQEATFLF